MKLVRLVYHNGVDLYVNPEEVAYLRLWEDPVPPASDPNTCIRYDEFTELVLKNDAVFCLGMTLEDAVKALDREFRD